MNYKSGSSLMIVIKNNITGTREIKDYKRAQRKYMRKIS
jgi:hypothetical protein